MIIHTAAWHLDQARLSCGHTASVRAGEHSTWCSRCARTVSVDRTRPADHHAAAHSSFAVDATRLIRSAA